MLPVNHSLASAVQWALEAGYRHIDTASLYRVEDEVGLGVRDYIRDNTADRRDLYVTTKVGILGLLLGYSNPVIIRKAWAAMKYYILLYLLEMPLINRSSQVIIKRDIGSEIFNFLLVYL